MYQTERVIGTLHSYNVNIISGKFSARLLNTGIFFANLISESLSANDLNHAIAVSFDLVVILIF